MINQNSVLAKMGIPVIVLSSSRRYPADWIKIKKTKYK
jgi:hypothetical protein